MADDPRRAGKFIDPGAALVDHFRSEDIRFFRRSRQSAESNHVCVAVKKNFLDVILDISIFDPGLSLLERGIHRSRQVAHPDHRFEKTLVRLRGLIGHGDMVRLHIKDEEAGLVLRHRSRVE